MGFVCCVLLESSFVKTINDELDSDDIGILNSGDTLLGFIFLLIWIGYNLYFLLSAMWLRHLQSMKLLMDSDKVADHTDDKYPKFLMSWKWFNDIADSGVEQWEQTRKDKEREEFEKLEKSASLRGQMKDRKQVKSTE